MNIENDFLTDFDLFGKIPEFYYKGKSKKSSILGIVLTILYIILYIAFLIYKLVRMFKREDVTFYDSYVFNGIPSIALTNNEFYGGFGMGGIIDEKMYWLNVTYNSEWYENGVKKTKVIPLETEKCKLDWFGPDYRDIFADQNVENYYCIKDFSGMVLEGYSNLERYSYFNVKFYPCVGKTKDGEDCYDNTTLAKFFTYNYVELKFQDMDVNPTNYKIPIVRKMIDMNSPVFKDLFQLIYSYLQIVNIETDEDITGLNFFSDTIKKEQYLRYDNSFLIASPLLYGAPLEGPNRPIADVTLQLAAKVLTEKREYVQLIDVLGDVGGLMEILFTLLHLISSFATEILYDKDLVNSLFSFDLNKKFVVFNYIKIQKRKSRLSNFNINGINYNDINDLNKINTIKLKEKLNESELESNKNIEIYSKEKNNNIELNNNNFNISNNNSLNKNTLSTTRKKLIKKRNNFNNNYNFNNYYKNISIKNSRTNLLQSKNSSSNNNNHINNTNNIKNENKVSFEDKNNNINDINKNKNNNDKNIEKIYNRAITTEEKQEKDLKSVYINNFLVCFFSCMSKKKNLNKILIEEGSQILSERLDIINMFYHFYIIEIIQKKLAIEVKGVNMSDYCKNRLQRYNYYIQSKINKDNDDNDNDEND